MESKLLLLVAGALVFGYIIAALFFLRFWRRTHDGLFLAFGLAFCLMAINQLALAFLPVPDDEVHYVYIIRIVAFLLILFAIVRKNIGKRTF